MIIHDLTGKTEEHLILNDGKKHLVFFYNTSINITAELAEKNTTVEIIGLFTPQNDQKFEVKTTQKHSVGENTSDLIIKSALFDASIFEYEGLIRIEKSAHKSHAYQKNQNLILSPEAFVDSRPFLEILANDVFCTHGSTTGKINKNHVFTAATRGLNEKKAKKMLIEGFFEDVLQKIQVADPDLAETYREKIIADIEKAV